MARISVCLYFAFANEGPPTVFGPGQEPRSLWQPLAASRIRWQPLAASGSLLQRMQQSVLIREVAAADQPQPQPKVGGCKLYTCDDPGQAGTVQTDQVL